MRNMWIGISGDRLLAIALAFMVTVALVGAASSETSASFTGTSTSPSNHVNTLLVQPPASQSNTTSSAAGAVSLAWAATPTAPGAGHTLSYDVLRGPVGGPYVVVGSTSALTFNDTPPADGSYGYVIRAKVTGGGTFTSGDSAARTGVSDRVAPTMSITCDGSACSSAWYDGAVSVTVSGIDSGTGMGSVTRKVDNGSQNSTAGASVTFNVSGNSAGHTVLYFGTDAAGNAASNTTITIKIDGAAPVAAKNVSGTAGQQNGEIDLTWTAGTDALSGVAYQTIHRSAAGTGNCPATTTANYPTAYAATATATAQTVGGLVSGASYCFYVETVDNAGNTKDSTKSARIVAN